MAWSVSRQKSSNSRRGANSSYRLHNVPQRQRHRRAVCALGDFHCEPRRLRTARCSAHQIATWYEHSNSSMMIVSYGKRLVADALEQNISSNGTADPTFARVTNLRKIYSVGRLSWQAEDLSTVFHADCGDGSTSSSCLGLQFPLPPGSSSSAEQRLVVNADALPVRLLPLAKTKHNLPLVQVSDPIPTYANGTQKESYDTVVGGVLLPHNVRNVTWDMSTMVSYSLCNAYAADRLYNVMNNHMYMENTLQPAYTAALFFLFQDAVVKDVIKMTDNQTTLMLLSDEQYPPRSCAAVSSMELR